MAVTTLYAYILAIIYIALAFAVIRNRYRLKVSLGDGGYSELNRVIRGHGNFSEYVPMGLLLMAIAEVGKADATFIHVIGATLLCGRLLHGYALTLTDGNMLARRTGMILTFASIAIGAGTCLLIGLRA